MRRWYDPIIEFFLITKLGNVLGIILMLFVMSFLMALAFPDGFYIPIRVVD